jgi:hypothetical protein
LTGVSEVLVALMMEAVNVCETVLNFNETRQCNIPGDNIIFNLLAVYV